MRHQLKVAALALLGFLVLALIVGFAGLGLLLLVGLALATLFTGGKAIILLLKLGKLLILLAIPLWLLVRSSVSALFVRLPAPQGLDLTRNEAPALFDAMAHMRKRMKGPRFHHVLLTDEMNAAVVQRPLFGLFGFPRNYLILGLPLLEALTPQEALAVVAHEYGHLAGSHGRFAAFIYRLRHSWGTIQALSQQWNGWTSRPLQALIRWYAPYFNAYTFVLARANEYQADAASAELVGADVAASALKRVNISAPHYDAYVARTFESIRERAEPPADFAVQWAAQAQQPPAAERASQWLREALERDSQVADTHPVLRERLRALPGAAQAADELPAPLAGASAATAWLGAGVAGLREALQQQWHQRVAEHWQLRHREVQEQRRRLDQLEALAEPGIGESLERLRLRIGLRPDEDHLPALSAFNAAHPDQPLGLFLEACLRLDHGDDGGIALLDRTIALDPDATLPACDRAYAFLKPRADERADAWAERWHTRQAWEAARDAQLGQLDVGHELRADELTAEQRQRAEHLLGLAGEGVKRAWIARRVLPADASIVTYVLGVELTAWASLRGQAQHIVDRLSAHEWPMHLFVCALDSSFKPLKKRFEALPAARVDFAR